MWTRMPDESVVRRINDRRATPAGSGSVSYSVPDLGALLGNKQFSIVQEDSSTVLIRLQYSDVSGPGTLDILVSRKTWLPIKQIFPAGPAGSIETGYHYEFFEGIPVLKQVSTVMGAMGFMKIDFSDYKKIKKMAKQSFKRF